MTNSIHDMGGMHGFGPVQPEPDEPVFHADWEKRVLAMQRAMGATRLWTIDGGRASLENLRPLDYLGSSYYRRWFLGLERRVVAHGLVGLTDGGRAGSTAHHFVGAQRCLRRIGGDRACGRSGGRTAAVCPS